MQVNVHDPLTGETWVETFATHASYEAWVDYIATECPATVYYPIEADECD